MMSCTFLCVWGDPSPQNPLGLNTDQRLTLTDRVAVLDEPLNDLSRPGRGERALTATPARSQAWAAMGCMAVVAHRNTAWPS